MTQQSKDSLQNQWSPAASPETRLSPLDIRERRFKTRFRGFDVREVDAFLDEIAELVDALSTRNASLEDKIRKLRHEINERRKHEAAVTRALEESHGTIEKMKDNAKRSAELIVSEAEVRAERILNRAHNRLAQLHEDIVGLKRQRVQIEAQIRAILESHSRLLDVSKEEMAAEDEEFSKLKFLKKVP